MLIYGDKEEAIEMMENAYDYHNNPRIKAHLEELLKDEGGTIEENTNWVGKKFPFNYVLPTESGDRHIALEDRLKDLTDREFLIVCALGSYRSNGPYDSFMQKFLILQTHFKQIFKQLDVITANKRQRNWKYTERQAIEAGLPVTVLIDQDNEVFDATFETCSPSIFTLNHQGIIIYHGRYTSELDMWQVVNKTLAQHDPPLISKS